MMCDVERVVRMLAQDRTSPVVDHAKVIMNTFSAVAQLPGWQHVQDFIIDPTAYVRRLQMLAQAYVQKNPTKESAPGPATRPTATSAAASDMSTEPSAPAPSTSNSPPSVSSSLAPTV